MKKIKLIFLCIIFASLILACLFTPDVVYAEVRTWTNEEPTSCYVGLSHGLFKDSKNQIWFGNEEGIVYRNWQQYELYSFDPYAECAIDFAEDKNGNIWISNASDFKKLLQFSNGTSLALIKTVDYPRVVNPNNDGEPFSIAIDKNTNIMYISDSVKNVIVRYNINTNTFTTLTGLSLSTPKGIDLDSLGNLWICDSGNNRIVKYNISTAISTPYKTTPLTPYDISCDKNNDVWIADNVNNRIIRYRVQATTWTTYEKSGSFVEPTSVFIDDNYKVYVTDSSYPYHVYSTQFPSSECNVTECIMPYLSADIEGSFISANYYGASIIVNLNVSDNASWKMYSDYTCTTTTEISNKTVNLSVGSNNRYYIKVFAQDGINNKVYTLVIQRLQYNLTVTMDNFTKVYGNADPSFTCKITSGTLQSGDSLTGNPSRTAGENVGTYDITKGSLTAGENYNITFINGTFSITEKTLCKR